MLKLQNAILFQITWFACVFGSANVIVDTAWIHLDFFHYKQHLPHSAIAPIWIIALWIAFALSINHSLTWLNTHPVLPALMGLIGAPLSYWAGQRIGAIRFTENPPLALSCLAITWAVVLWFLFNKSQSKKV